MSDFGQLPSGLALVPVDQIQPCPIQPRVNFSVDLIEQLTTSMRAGRHQPLLEVEPAPGAPCRYQIVCGEQRWRAARAAGLTEVLVRVHRPLGYLERLERQYEENCLRADLDPVEEAHCLLLDHTIRSIAVAERLLRDALVPFQPLADRRITSRAEFGRHLDHLRELLVRQRVHVVKSADGGLRPGMLSPWRETEQALGVSESSRKAKVSVLRLDPDVQEQVRALPAEHAIQISRLRDRRRQTELATRARDLTHDQVRAAVERLRRDQDLPVQAALEPLPLAREGPISLQQQLATLADLCRQLLRLFDNIRPRLSPDERRQQRIARRILELVDPGVAWQRQLWSVGTLLSLRESLEAAAAHAASVLNEEAARDLWKRTSELVISDPGLGSLATRHLIRNCLHMDLVPNVSEYSLLQGLLATSSQGYIARWSAHIQSGGVDPPEQAARLIASHLLDDGFSAQYLYDWLIERLDVDPAPLTFADVLQHLNELHATPETHFAVLAAFEAAPIRNQELPNEWRTGEQVRTWLIQKGFRGAYQSGGLVLSITARDVWSALDKVSDLIDAIRARFAIGTRRRVRFVEEIWIDGYPHPFRLQRRRRGAEVGSIERSGKLYSMLTGAAVDSAIELLGPLNDGQAAAAISGAWSAVEALLVRPDDRQRGVAASDRLAALVACSVPRAELTGLAYAHAQSATNALAAAIAAAPTNRQKAALVAEALAARAPLSLADFDDVLAAERVSRHLASPKRELSSLRNEADQAFRRLYRQRNLLMHWGKTDSVAQAACLRTAAAIVAAGIDRIAHAWFVSQIEPLALAAKAQQRILVADQAGATALVDLLE